MARRLLAGLIGCVLASAVTGRAAAQGGIDDILINEIQASNRSTLMDEDGDFVDWIELLNAGTSVVDLEGWSLSDDPFVPGKWFFPSVTLPPGGFLVIHASGKNRDDPRRPLHTNFELRMTGEYVGLFRPDFSVASEHLFPAQVEDFSYGLSQGGTFERLVASAASVRVLVPADGSLGTSWTQVGFADGGWSAARTGVGYDRSNDYLPLINADVRGDMDGGNTSCYARITFTVDDASVFSSLALRMKYDDGFIAYINGRRVASRNAPATPAWNSNATGQNDDSRAVVFEDIELDEIAPAALSTLLRDGENVLAIHGLNVGSGSSDFLVLPELDAVGVGELDRDLVLFFPRATPGGPNLAGYPGVASRPRFTEPSQVFTGSLSVALTAAEPGGVIRYTTNGEEPDEGSAIYRGPIGVSSSTLIRARVFVDGLAPSPTVSEGYIGIASSLASFTSDVPIVVVENFNTGGIPGDPHKAAFMAIFEPIGGRASFRNEPHLVSRIGIKRRGSSTGGRQKASYTFEFWDEFNEDINREPLGLPRESDWVLYGAYNFDRAHIRNAFIYTISNQVGRWAARSRFCELYLNTGSGPVSSGDDYRGIYTFMEKIKRGPDRVDVEKLTADDRQPPDVTGGYMVKIDRLDPGDGGFNAGGRRLGFVYPKEDRISPEQRSYLANYINTMVDSLSNRNPTTGYRRYIDVESWVDHHILNVIANNVDALRLSTYMFKGRERRYEYGPIWDFDRSMESTDGRDDNPTTWNGTGDGTRFFEYPWWSTLFNDPDFWQDWIDRWSLHRRGPLSNANMGELIQSMANTIRGAQPRDLARWGQNPRFGGFQGEVNHMQQWLVRRANWIDSRFVDPPRFSSPGGEIQPGFELTITGDGTIHYTLDGSDPRRRGGGVAPGATRYSGPITIDRNTRVIARVLGNGAEGSDWSGPTDETYVTETPRLVITELMYHPPAPTLPSGFGTEEYEYVELMNASGSPIEIAGASFTNGIRFEFPPDEPPLAAGEFVVLVRNLEAFALRYDVRTIRIGGEFLGHLASEGERLILLGPLREPILDFTYSDQWHPSTDGRGDSLNIIDPAGPLADWGLAESWSPSSVRGGTPGLDDSTVSGLGGRQRPGDSNQDGVVDVSDCVSLLRRLFVDGASELPCDGASLDAGGNLTLLDVNADGRVDVSDPLFLLEYLFKEGPAPRQGTECVRIEGCPSVCFF